jgi:hypothetical protein
LCESSPPTLELGQLKTRLPSEPQATFRCNKRPLLVLLERGFIQRTLEDEMPPKYIAFLSEMLNRPFEDTGTELLVALCNQVALISQVEFQREKLMDSHVLLPLIELLRSDHDVLLLAVAKARSDFSATTCKLA